MNVWLVYESVGSSVMPVTYNVFDSRKAAVDYIMSELEGYSDYGRGGPKYKETHAKFKADNMVFIHTQDLGSTICWQIKELKLQTEKPAPVRRVRHRRETLQSRIAVRRCSGIRKLMRA